MPNSPRYLTMESVHEASRQPRRLDWQGYAFYMLAYFLGAELGHLLSFGEPTFAIFWPPYGIFVAVLLLTERKQWGGVIAASIVANFASDFGLHGRSLLSELGYNLANVCEAVLAALLTQRFLKMPLTFSSMGRYLTFVATAGLVGPVVGATIGSSVVYLSLGQPGEPWSPHSWVLWLVSDAFGVLTFGALIVAWFCEKPVLRRDRLVPAWEAALVLWLVAISAAIGFSWPPHEPQNPVQYPMLVCPALVWAGLRLGRRGALVASMITSLISIAMTAHGYGLYAHYGTTLFEKVTAMQLFILQVQILPLVLAIIVDETRRAERVSSSQYKLLSGVLEGVDDGIVLKDRAGRFHVVNPAAAALYHTTVDEMIGKTDADFLPSDVVAKIREDDLRSIDEERPLLREERWDSPEGDMFFLTTRSPFRDEAGQVGGVIGIVRNITHLRHTSAALIVSEGRFRTLANTGAAGVFETDAQGRCVYLNPRWCELTGLEPEEGLGDGWIRAVHPEDVERVVGYWRGQVAAASEEILQEFRFLRPDGQTIWVHTFASAIRDERAAVRGFIGACLDVTARRQAEESLREANERLEQRVAERTRELQAMNAQLHAEMAARKCVQEKLHDQQLQLAHVSRVSTMGEMAASLAHELNQPLYAIRNYLSGLQRRLAGSELPAYLSDALAEVSRETDRAAEIIRRTRQFVGQGRPHMSPLNLNAIVEDAVELVEFEAKRRGMQVEFKPASGLPLCLADSVALQQVIVNLIRNAFDAMESQPGSDRVVRLETMVEQGQVGLCCHDTGSGIAPDNLPRVFQAFFTTKADGLGMGLAISRTIMEAHGGQLTLQQHDGQGTTFCCFLPVLNEKEYREGNLSSVGTAPAVTSA